MKTFRERTKGVLRDFFSLAKKSGGLIAYSIVMYVLFVISHEGRHTEGIAKTYSLESLAAYGAPFLILVYVLLYRFRSDENRKFSILVGLIPAVLLAWWVSKGIEPLMKATMIVTGIVLSLMLLIVTYPGCGKEDKRLVMKTYDIFLSISSTLFLGFSLMLLLWGIIESVSFLLEIEILDDHKMYIEFFIPFVIMPLIYRMLEARFVMDDEEESLIFNVTFNYLLTYAALIYTVIILLYLVKCLVTLTVPNGVFATISVVMYLLGLLVYVSRYLPYRPTKFATWLGQQYKWAVIPTIMLYAWAVGVRVEAYGLTEARVYLVAFGLIMLATAVSLFGAPRKVYRTTLYACFLVMGVLSYNFLLTPYRLSYWSQEHRMYSLAKELEYVDTETGKLISVDEMNAKSDGTDRRIEEFKMAYGFVTAHSEAAKKIYEKYGKIDETDVLYKESEMFDPMAERSVWLHQKKEEWQVDATPYRSIYLNPSTMMTDNGEIGLYMKDSLLITCPVDTVLNEINAKYNLDEISGSFPMKDRMMIRCGGYDIFFAYLDLRYRQEDGWGISAVRVELVGALK